ncbi:unnamed protein product [Hymenolepis diminuta]|uniref:DUF5727 domain-containing protein n=1 Tax=Hymenolepis diminuta TaxID=6216 RepID=A0A564ZCD3_HYMDI|nr:unnamed protein product [Hymenolepis diminuta]
MTFEWTSMQDPLIINGGLSGIYVEEGKCRVAGREIGSSCKNESDGKHLEIMVNDVTTGKALVIGSGKFFISFAPFIPKCEFEQPKEGTVCCINADLCLFVVRRSLRGILKFQTMLILKHRFHFHIS